ncbi:hypothetical protein IODZLFCR_CDS0016 [Salmonella phage vB_SalP_SE29]|uniref:Uncharacterized protein n=1 Tax=Salmonella phage vB_SalP_SE29 TaxID=3134913 RepID=A0AAX4LXE4_9CAUD
MLPILPITSYLPFNTYNYLLLSFSEGLSYSVS